MNKTIILLSLITLLFSCADYNILNKPPDAVQLSAIDATDTTVTLRWTQSNDDDFAGYRVYYSQNDIVDTTDELADTIKFRFDTTKVVHGLLPDTRYYFRVFVVNSSGMIMGSNNLEQPTLRDANSIELFDPDSVMDTVAYLRWSKCHAAEARRYVLMFDTTATLDSSSNTAQKIIKTSINDTSVTVPGLLRAKKHYFKVFVQDGLQHFIASSNTIMIEIERGYPSPIRLWVDSATDTTARLRWNKNLDADFSSYRIFMSQDNQADTSDSLLRTSTASMDTIFQVTNLPSGRQFWFVIAVKNDRGLVTLSNTRPNIPVVLSMVPARTTDSTIGLYWTICQFPGFSMYKLVRDTLPVVSLQQGFEVALLKPEKADANSYTDTIADTTKTFHYRIFVSEKDSSNAILVSGSNDLKVLPSRGN